MRVPVSPVRSLERLAGRNVTVGDVVREPLWSVTATEPAQDAADVMRARCYDVAGVVGKSVTSYVVQAELDGQHDRVGNHCHEIVASEVIEQTMPLADVIPLLARSPFLFVLAGGQVVKVITAADLQAPAVSVVVLSHLIAIETGLKHLCANEITLSWISRLSQEARARVDRLYEQKRKHNAEIGYAECLNFEDWLRVAASTSWLLQSLDLDERKWNGKVNGLSMYRNTLAHGGSVLDHRTPSQVSKDFDRIRDLMGRIWRAIERERPRWDDFLRTHLYLAGPVSLTGRDAVEELPLDSPAFVITAWNPEGVRRPDSVNRNANRRLLSYLRRQGLPVTNVVGEAFDGSWREDSFLVYGITRARATEIARQFAQMALFEVTHELLGVVSCMDGSVVRSSPRNSNYPA